MSRFIETMLLMLMTQDRVGIERQLCTLICMVLAFYLPRAFRVHRFEKLWFSMRRMHRLSLDDRNNASDLFEACVWWLRDRVWDTRDVSLYNTQCEIQPATEEDRDPRWVRIFNVWPSDAQTVTFEHRGHTVNARFTVEEEDTKSIGKRLTRHLALSSATMTTKDLTDMIESFETQHKSFLTGQKPRLFQHNCKGFWLPGTTWNHSKTASNVVLDKRSYETLQRKVSDFMTSAKTENARLGMSWSCGILLHGPPGTGKTSCIKMLSHEHSLDVYMLSMARIKHPETLVALFEGLPHRPHILAIDDFDGSDLLLLRQSPDARDHKQESMLGTMLQCMDGLNEPCGRLVIVTTNHPERIDAAFKRKRRIDLIVELGRCDHEMIQRIHRMFYDVDISPDDLARIPEHAITPVEVFDAFTTYRTDPAGAIAELSSFLSG